MSAISSPPKSKWSFLVAVASVIGWFLIGVLQVGMCVMCVVPVLLVSLVVSAVLDLGPRRPDPRESGV